MTPYIWILAWPIPRAWATNAKAAWAPQWMTWDQITLQPAWLEKGQAHRVFGIFWCCFVMSGTKNWFLDPLAIPRMARIYSNSSHLTLQNDLPRVIIAWFPVPNTHLFFRILVRWCDAKFRWPITQRTHTAPSCDCHSGTPTLVGI